MDLDDSEIWLKDEKIHQPKNETFAVVIGFMGIKPFGRQKTLTAAATTISEELTTNLSAQVVIDIQGRTFDVLTRQVEIIQAMASTECKEAQLKGGFLIGEIPTSANDVSGLDGAAIPYRFQLTFSIQFKQTKTKVIELYDNYRLDDVLTEG